MKPLNIAIVVGPFPSVSQTFIVNQITSLIDEGHKIKIFAYRKGNTLTIHDNILSYNLLENVVYNKKHPFDKLRRFSDFLKLTFQNLFLINWYLLFKSLNFFKYGKRAINLEIFYERKFFILNKKFDVIHVHFATNAIDIAKYKSEGFLKRSKLVVSFHGFDINPSKIEFYKTRYKNLFEETDQFTVNTNYTKEILLQANPTLTNVFILPESLDINLFKRKEKQHQIDQDFKIVYCGRLVPFKGGVLLPRIIEELLNRGNNVNLKVIGDGELKTSIENEIERLNLKNAIELVGAITQEEIIEIFNNSNVFLLPGIYETDGRAENQGLVIQEAQAMELPVVVSDVGGMKYGMIPNETGFLVKENDISAFADAIENLIENKKLRESMGLRGREYVVANFDNKVLGKRLLAIYQDILTQ